jgi:hypothetical protein
MPASTERLLSALGAPVGDYAGAEFAAAGSELQVAELEPLFPKR